MRLVHLSEPAKLPALAADWHRLAAGMPLRTYAWLASWWEHYGQGRELLVLAVEDEGGRLVGLAPWYRETSAAKGSTIALMGSGEVCSDYQSILAEPACLPEVAAVLARWLQREGGDAWDLLRLEGIAAGDPGIEALVAELQQSGLSIHERPGPNCWRIDLPNSWEAYVELLSKSHRKQVRRVDRRLVETGQAVLQRADDASQLRQALGLLIDLHQKRRASLGQPGCFADPRFEGFVRTAAARLLEAGMLRLYSIELAGKPVAVEMQIAGGGVTYAYQAGIDPEALDEEPGRLINIATLKQAIADGQRGFDFLRGDEPYKAHWRAQPQACLELRIVPRRAAAQWRHSLWLAGDCVKQVLKSGMSFTGGR